ncbi:MAG TPA: hypothetical protein VKB33_01395 [Nitrospira sp.]|nr:hypothetical protein [Nitrospira sp.]
MLTLLKPWTKNWRRAAAITAWAAERSVDNLSALEVRTGMDHQKRPWKLYQYYKFPFACVNSVHGK